MHEFPSASLDAPLVTGLACNEYGAELIGQQIEPLIREAAQAEGYGWLPAQQEPVVMNTKGASASGKSTMRPLQKKLAGEIGVGGPISFSLAMRGDCA